MRIGIDATYIRPGENGGTESYLRNLLKGLNEFDPCNEYFIFLTKQNFETFTFDNPRISKILCKISGKNRILRILYVSLIFFIVIKKLDLDVMFFPTYIRCFFNLGKVKSISNLHDLQYKHYPEYFSRGKRWFFNAFYRLSVKQSDLLICISKYVKSDIINHFSGINQKKLRVIYNPIIFDKGNCDTIFSRLKLENTKYILSVATLAPHKNLKTLIRAFQIMKQAGCIYKLVLVGNQGKILPEITQIIGKIHLEEDIIITGYVNDAELYSLYRHASLYVCTSTFEGFGMPPVEAMGMGIPVISTRCASLYEVTLGLVTYYNDPYDARELVEKINATLQTIDTEMLQHIGETVREKYNLKVISLQYIACFESFKSIKPDELSMT